ncbi:urease accessory protein UreF [Pseudoclavibacter helvolus]|uniref:urease accessory protein UreF n=1 Tax=Pseudoclavibacter helvolus TaxID=255205 RepID=UPI0024AD616A|nr:urease accessory UreF family protein [Pseudoclavibacter helvolus]
MTFPRAHSLTLALLLSDARLPSGGHAHSAGMEPAISAGMPVALVPAFLAGRARTTTIVEAGTAVVTRHLLLEAGDDSGEVDAQLARVERAWAARTPSAALREASRVLGRGYLRLASRLWPESSALAGTRARGTAPPRAVVLGMIAAASGLTAPDLVRSVVYDEVQSAAAALLKLEPRDPADVTVWVLDTCASVDHLVPAIAALTTPDAIPASGAPQSEGWAEAHALTSQRLFRA